MFQRLLDEVSKVIRNSLELETVSRRDGWLQRADPRFVVIILISLLVTAVLLRNTVSIVVVLVFTYIMAITSKVPMGWYLKRIWLFVPFFTVVIMIPSMTNLITPGQMVGTSITMLGRSIYFTKGGLLYALTFTLRVGAAVSLSVLLVATVEWSKLMRALSQLRLPSSFVLILDMTYRYIHVLLNTVTNMFMAKKSRMVGKPSTDELRTIGGSSVTCLFSKSLNMSEQVYLAMMSRGYTGEAKGVVRFKSCGKDYLFAVGVAVFAVFIIIFDITIAQTTYASLLSTLGALL